MIEIDPRSPVPINDQIKAGLKGLVSKGILKPGDQAPSIRALAVSLRVNPNTVARAFRELALEGFFETRRGAASVVSQAATRSAKDGLGEVRDTLSEGLRQARRGGLSWHDIDALLRKTKAEEA